MERGFLLRQTEEHRAKLGSLNDQRAQKEAERDTTAATIAKLEATEPIINQRVRDSRDSIRQGTWLETNVIWNYSSSSQKTRKTPPFRGVG